ncbi:MAG: conserved membrane protein of unknown function [Promethearchaeota archaeon]|nr:MAG: conserved membrane protein of unknown function [Candidatus Lokiarchaeota archaeon]
MNSKNESKRPSDTKPSEISESLNTIKNEQKAYLPGHSNLKQYFLKSTKKTYSHFFKDLEISRSYFITLQLIYLVFVLIMQNNIYYIFDIEVLLYHNNLTLMLLLSLFMGLLAGGFFVDRIRGKKTSLLLTLMLISLVLIIFHAIFFKIELDIFPMLLLSLNSFISGIIFLFFLVAFIESTTILERGRVFSYLSTIMGVFIFLNLLFISIILIFINSIITYSIAIFFLNKRRKAETPLIYIPIIKKEQIRKKVGVSLLKYFTLLTFFGFIVGLNIPFRNLFLIQKEWELFTLLLAGIILAIFTSISIGFIYDLFGRRTVVSSAILTISLVDFIRIFIAPNVLAELAFSVICVLILYISIPLLIGDISYKSDIGVNLAIAYTLSFTFLFIGLYLRTNILNIGMGDLTSELLLNSIISIAAIFILFFLVNSKETLSAKEQNWPEHLIHLYVIHTSGLLLYDFPFKEENLGDSDLAAGGFIGLLTILQEIVREDQRVRVIDHGGKLILFGFNTYKTLVFALIITEELLILRHKLNNFIHDIDENYPIEKNKLSGIDKQLWKDRITPLVKNHFKRKYFELIDFKRYK